MWLTPQETGDLVTFTEEILNGNFHFLYSVHNLIQMTVLFKYTVVLYYNGPNLLTLKSLRTSEELANIESTEMQISSQQDVKPSNPQLFKRKCFALIVNGFSSLTIVEKLLDIWRSPWYTSALKFET